MVVAEGTALITSIKAAMDIVNILKSSHDDHTISKAQSEIFDRLLAIQANAAILQEKHSALVNEKNELAEKVMQFEQWVKTESEYELKKLTCGILVYSYKSSQNSKKPMHCLCPNCWEDRKKSILQIIRKTSDGIVYCCYRCKYDFFIHNSLIH